MDVFVARQPIFDAKKQVVAYELLFRDGVQNVFPSETGADSATRSVISHSYMTIGFESLTGGKKAFINFTESNIQTGLAKLVPEQFLAVEILETVEPTEDVINACHELKKAGYMIVLDDFVFKPKYQPFIELADIIKIDFIAVDSPSRRKLFRKIIPEQVALLAEKVETEEEFIQGVNFGYAYFQGFFFSKPVVISRKEISPTRITQLQLVHEVSREDVEPTALEEIIKRDVSLTYKLFKYVNSAYFGFRNEIKSIRQAIVLLGIWEIRRWVALVTIKGLSEDKPAELLTTAITRGRLCELIARETKRPELLTSSFLVGMFSLLDALLDRPMQEILAELSLAPEVCDALTGKPSALSTLLHLAKAYEKAEWPDIGPLAGEIGISEGLLPGLYGDAIAWAEKVQMA